MDGNVAPARPRTAAVVGGGYAGMAAAVRLLQGGRKVTVFESAPTLGGRARRVQSRGETWDNGQHILVGAYTALLRQMQLLGVSFDALLCVPLELRYADGFRFRALWLPAPLGLLGGLLLAGGIPFAERIGAIRFMVAMRRTRFRLEADCTVSELLTRHAQQGRIGHYLWRPLCISALNTPPEAGSANAFLAVLRDSLAGDARASDLLLPKVDLSRLFPEPAADYLRSRGCEVNVSTPAPPLEALRAEYDHVVIAVGPHQLKAVAPELAQEFSYQPICTCYLQYDSKVHLPFPMIGFADGLVQWAFDRGSLLGEKGRIACVISAQGDYQQMQQDELAEACHREIAAFYPQLGSPASSRVIIEKRATIACTPGRPRIGVETPWPNVYLAGDYTDPEYPPTLEAAVRSGLRAAELALKPSQAPQTAR
jgi:squalene-associated FAD-dependent desaturase